MRALLTALPVSFIVASTAAAASFTVVNNGIIAYRINGIDNPTLNLVRGNTYTFSVTATGHPFYIKTVQGSGTGNAYPDGVTGNGTQVGTVTWVVAGNAPSLLYYDCAVHEAMTGDINITGSTGSVPSLTPWTGAALLALLAGAG